MQQRRWQTSLPGSRAGNTVHAEVIIMAHADKGMGGAYASATHSAGALKKTKQAGGKGVSEKKRPKS